MKLIVLGAGASYGASRFAEIRSPMVSGILATATKLGLVDPEYARQADARLEADLRSKGANMDYVKDFLGVNGPSSHLRILRRFVQEQFGISADEYLTAPIDFERLFALVEAELLGYHGLLKLAQQSPKGPGPADVLEMQTMLVLCGSILGATRDFTCDYHDALARWLEPGDAVLSFNYDLLIDRSLKGRGDLVS